MKIPHGPSFAVAGAALLFACSAHRVAPRPEPAATASTAPTEGASAALACPAKADVPAFLERHARAFGTREAVSRLLPMRVAGELEVGGKKAPSTVVLDAKTYRQDLIIAGLAAGEGEDESGPWTLGLHGAVLRPTPDERIGHGVFVWVLRRAYLSAIDPARDGIECADVEGEPTVRIRSRLPSLGDPTLTFRLRDAALRSVSSQDALGTVVTESYDEWQKSGDASWPRSMRVTREHGSPQSFTASAFEHIASCNECRTAPLPTVSAGALKDPVRMPMTFVLNEVVVDASVGSIKTVAFLDSGAGLSALDSSTPLGSTFRPAIAIEGGGATQKLMVGVGEIRDVSVGALRFPRLPVASVPIPALSNFGPKRPELILGFSLFATYAVRIDYDKGFVSFSSDGSTLHATNATRIPLEVISDKALVEIDIDGTKGLIELDTGSAGALGLARAWAAPNGFPGARKTSTFVHIGGAGTKETTSILFKVDKVTLGPITATAVPTQLDDPPSPPKLAGLLGNQILSRCRAVVIDVPARSLFLEGPCDRRPFEIKAGWTLVGKPDPKWPDRPWLVGNMVAGGNAETAGLRATDRLLTVDGAAATVDRMAFERTISAAGKGAKFKLEIVRDDKKMTLILELRD